MILLQISPAQLMPVIERNPDIKQIIIISSAFVCIIIWTVIKVLYKNYFSQIFVDVFRKTFQKNIKLAEVNKNTLAKILILASSIISLSASTSAIIYYHPLFNTLHYDLVKTFYYLLMFFTLIVFLHKPGLQILGLVFDFYDHFDFYSVKSINLIIILSISVFPFFILFPFIDQKYIIILSIIIFIFFILIVIFKFLIFFYYIKEIKFFNLYSFLYFCSAEILPLIFLHEVVNNFVR